MFKRNGGQSPGPGSLNALLSQSSFIVCNGGCCWEDGSLDKKLKINPPPNKLFNNKVSFHFPSNSALRRRRTRKKNMIHKMIFIPLFIDSKIGKDTNKTKQKLTIPFKLLKDDKNIKSQRTDFVKHRIFLYTKL
ncbi:unnamed protein product [Sphagnum jensenii]|uniref:Uncharacterized protein n=1 Tax=Sphagnum jensenii TaxID=128206 RepID=A0ABP0XJP6_9BRYO